MSSRKQKRDLPFVLLHSSSVPPSFSSPYSLDHQGATGRRATGRRLVASLPFFLSFPPLFFSPHHGRPTRGGSGPGRRPSFPVSFFFAFFFSFLIFLAVRGSSGTSMTIASTGAGPFSPLFSFFSPSPPGFSHPPLLVPRQAARSTGESMRGLATRSCRRRSSFSPSFDFFFFPR